MFQAKVMQIMGRGSQVKFSILDPCPKRDNEGISNGLTIVRRIIEK
jgi:hypothetical protein